jgi:hypothetical protein
MRLAGARGARGVALRDMNSHGGPVPAPQLGLEIEGRTRLEANPN